MDRCHLKGQLGDAARGAVCGGLQLALVEADDGPIGAQGRFLAPVFRCLDRVDVWLDDSECAS